MNDKVKEPPKFTITRSEGSVWVNGTHNCLGRFTPNGWEIYKNMNAPVEVVGTTRALDLTKKPTNIQAWNSFVKLMKAHHAIDLSGEKYPGKEETK